MSMSVSHTATHKTSTPSAGSVWSQLFAMAAVTRQRRKLAQLDDHLLADIGVSRQDALTESRKTVWDVPQNWRG